MDGGAWRRLQRAGMMHIIRVVLAMLASAMVCGFGASERPYPALAAYGLLRRLGGCLVTGRARDYREADRHGSKLGCCVCSAIGTGLCRNLGGVAVLRSGVVPKITHFASSRTVGREKMTC